MAGDFRNESGPVELCHTGEWYKVCNNSNLRRVSVAQVLCRQLGYHTDGKISVFTFKGILLYKGSYIVQSMLCGCKLI